MEPEDDGIWCFRLYANGSAYWNSAYSFSPMADKWLVCNRKTYLPTVFDHDKKNYAGKSEDEILQQYDAWARKQ